MIADIEAGIVKRVIIKDMSRLGRDYLQVGMYTEIMFPEHDVHFIAVNDGVDSKQGDNEFTPFRNIINEWYAKDTSKKIRAVMKVKGNAGEHLTTNAPYGYMKDPANPKQWVRDNDAANVVYDIGLYVMDGYGPSQIARLLKQRKILTPAAYYESKGINCNVKPQDDPYGWNASTVAHILDRWREYLGHTVNFKTTKKSYKSKKKIQNPEIHNEQYQNGTLAGWENLKAYAKWRDGYKCRVCGKSPRVDSSVRLEVHHIRRRADGGSDTQGNVVTLCHGCHEAHHQKKKVLKFKKPPTHRDEAHMNVMRRYLQKSISMEFDHRSIGQEYTYGYATAIARREHGIEKSHSNDAYCIAGNFNAAHTPNNVYLHKFVRRHNRRLHKATILKGGYRKPNQSPKYVYGYRLFDGVRYKGMDCFVFGRRSRGEFDIRRLDGMRVSTGASCKRLKHLTKSTTILTERKACNSSQV